MPGLEKMGVRCQKKNQTWRNIQLGKLRFLTQAIPCLLDFKVPWRLWRQTYLEIFAEFLMVNDSKDSVRDVSDFNKILAPSRAPSWHTLKKQLEVFCSK